MDALTGSAGTCRFLRGVTGYDAELSRLSEAERLLGQALQAAEESNRALVTEAAKADGSKNENHPDAEFSDERDDEIRKEYAEANWDDLSDVNWAVRYDIISNADRELYYSVVDNHIPNKRRLGNVHRTVNGGYIIESGNVMMYTDGNRRHHSIERVIRFDTEFEEEMTTAKEELINEERRTGDTQKAIRAIEAVFGHGFAVQYTAGDYGAAYSSPGRGKGKRSGANTRGSSGRKTRSVKDILYFEAVSNGDAEAEQRMVNESAENAGYIQKAFHGTNETFYVFDVNKAYAETARLELRCTIGTKRDTSLTKALQTSMLWPAHLKTATGLYR